MLYNLNYWFLNTYFRVFINGCIYFCESGSICLSGDSISIHSTVSLTYPLSVNFRALPSKFKRTCLSRIGSLFIIWLSSSSLFSEMRFKPLHFIWNFMSFETSRRTLVMLKGKQFKRSFPLFIWVKSRISLMRERRW